MEVKSVLQLVVVLLLAALNGARAASVNKYFREGGNMVLEPKVAATITNILWKHEGNLLAEWIKDVVNLTYYDTFEGRTTLSIITGRLMITKMTKNDTGDYTLEINSNVLSDSYTAKMIKEVPEPLVWVQPVACTHESKSCALLCEGIPPEDKEFGPITYSWRRDEGDWIKSEKEMTIDKDTSATETFSCRIENPVSMKDSQPIKNSFHIKPRPGPPIGVIVGVLILVAVLIGTVVGYKKRHTIMAKFRSHEANERDANGSPAVDPETRTTENLPLKEDGERTTGSG